MSCAGTGGPPDEKIKARSVVQPPLSDGSGKFGAAGNFSWSGYDFRRCGIRRRTQGALRRHPTLTVIVYARDHDERTT
jgi:hypothetical protein